MPDPYVRGLTPAAKQKAQMETAGALAALDDAQRVRAAHVFSIPTPTPSVRHAK